MNLTLLIAAAIILVLAVLLANLVVEGEPVAIGRGESDTVYLLQRRDHLEAGGRRVIGRSGGGGGDLRGRFRV